jgi:hypothetical protein
MPNLLDIYYLIKEEKSENITIFVDMDGVIADFDQRFFDIAKMTPGEFKKEHGIDKFWDLIDEENKLVFWTGIPVMDGAKKLIDYVSNYHYEILTAPSIKKQSEEGKKIWLRDINPNLFPNTPKLNFKSSKEKHLIKPTLTKNDILIDDRGTTIDTWEAAGGTGIKYTSAGQAIKDTKEAIKLLKNSEL